MVVDPQQDNQIVVANCPRGGLMCEFMGFLKQNSKLNIFHPEMDNLCRNKITKTGHFKWASYQEGIFVKQSHYTQTLAQCMGH